MLQGWGHCFGIAHSTHGIPDGGTSRGRFAKLGESLAGGIAVEEAQC